MIVAIAMLLEQEVRELAAAFTTAFSESGELNDLAASVLERFRRQAPPTTRHLAAFTSQLAQL
ncbi:hypothetical protein WT72_25520 [Burkholderia pseudomultivorans]|uniref:Uncharacterized protein n=1 Tax=Burkholderia pseudomultivorans TaxID=1207504 RepID=A0A132EUT0_9BURK|nr:hypothetical protein WT57_28020 [Burkholderia pseudomultivorans]KWI50515.1 hypothetical protein WT72_25520 [Burkholderia pseudomultivorans]